MIPEVEPPKKYSSKVTQLLKVDYEVTTEPWVTSQRALRVLIGVLGMALPLLLIIVTTLDVNYFYPLDSISHYYFTRANSIFIIVVSLLAIFLLIYKGLEPVDFYLSAIAGICALLLVCFPTSSITDTCNDPEKAYSITILRPSEPRVIFHYASAGIFLLCLAFMSIFLFTKSKTPKGQRPKTKQRRNGIYVTCGVIMIVALLVVFVGGFFEVIPPETYNKLHLTFWMETVAVEAFGFSWLVKGETLFKDK